MRFLCLITLPVVLGCGAGAGDEFPAEWDAEIEAAESQAFVAKSRVVERGGIVVWKENQRPFTGRTVEYTGGFIRATYVNGKEPDWCPVDTDPPELFPKDPAYQQAVRDWVAEHGISHNEFFFFSDHGTEADIPALLSALEKLDVDVSPETPGTRICSHAHCVGALEKITGVKCGDSYADWKAWWIRTHNTEAPRCLPKEP